MAPFIDAAKKYWFDLETNIFKNYIDAILGSLVLIVLPAISLISAVIVDTTTWANYLFPIVSICLAGIYDTYGRYEPGSPKNIKLGVRVVFDLIAMFLAALLVGESELILRLIAPGLLLLLGLSLVIEVIWRVKTAIELSCWYSKL